MGSIRATSTTRRRPYNQRVESRTRSVDEPAIYDRRGGLRSCFGFRCRGGRRWGGSSNGQRRRLCDAGQPRLLPLGLRVVAAARVCHLPGAGWPGRDLLGGVPGRHPGGEHPAVLRLAECRSSAARSATSSPRAVRPARGSCPSDTRSSSDRSPAQRWRAVGSIASRVSVDFVLSVGFSRNADHGAGLGSVGPMSVRSCPVISSTLAPVVGAKRESSKRGLPLMVSPYSAS